MGNLARRVGMAQPPQDPRVKIPDVGSFGAREAFERTGSVVTGDIADLRKALADARADIVGLSTRVDDQDAKIAALLASMTKVTPLPETVIALPAVTQAALPGKTPKLTAAEKQRAYRERQKAKA